MVAVKDILVGSNRFLAHCRNISIACVVFLLIESHHITLDVLPKPIPWKIFQTWWGVLFSASYVKYRFAFCPVISCLSVDVALVGLSRIEGTRILSQLIQFHKNILDVMGWSSSVMIQSHEKYSRYDGVSLASYETSSRHSAHEKYLSHAVVCS